MKRLLLVLAAVLIMLVGCASQPQTTATPALPTSAPTSAFIAPTPSYAVEVTKDIEYVTLLQPGAPAQKLNVYAPAKPGPWPVVVIMHYGFTTKDDILYTTFAEDLAGRGVVVFVPQRRSLSATVMDAAKDNGRELREVFECWDCAIRFVREKAADYGGDAEWMTVFGDGARGLETALSGDDLPKMWDELASRRGGPPPQTGCLAEGESGRVNSFVAWGGDYEAYEVLKDLDPEVWELSSFYALIGRNPGLVLHLIQGAMDSATMLDRASAYCQALQDAGYEATLTRVPDVKAMIPWSGPGREALLQAILEAALR